MNHLVDFESFMDADGEVRCPMCAWDHTAHEDDNVLTRFCTEQHLPGAPHQRTGAYGDPPEPHLHRKCRRCGYVWLEHVAPPLEDPSVPS